MDAAAHGAVERAVPASIAVTMGREDVTDLRFLGIPRPQSHSVIGRVETAMTWRRQLTVELSRASEPGAVLQSVALGPSGVFEFTGVPVGQYLVSVKAGSGLRAYVTHTEPVEPTPRSSTVAGAAVAQVPTAAPLVLHFTATLRPHAQEVEGSSFVALFLVTLLVVAVVKRKEVVPLVLELVDRLSHLRWPGAAAAATAATASPAVGTGAEKRASSKRSASAQKGMNPTW